MRLTIIYILLILTAGTILFLTKDYEENKTKREIEEQITWQQKQDSIAKAEEAIYQNHIKPYLDNPFQDTIDLSGLALKKLPQDFLSKMLNLKYLDLSDNKFRELPKGIFEHDNLEVLDLSNNQILYLHLEKNIPYVHHKLKKLILKNAGLSQYPDINYFPNIEYLDISHNISLSHVLHFENAECLKLSYIDCSHNGFVDIRGIENFPNLQILIANNNNIVPIPKFLYNEKLQYLDLSHNDIINFTFPEYTEILLELKTLKINNNNLKSIRKNVALSNLQHLEIRNNKILYLFDTFDIKKNYPSLTYLDLRGNSLKQDETTSIPNIDTLILK
ncbi:MAG: leucine-rich repeat domain-containing protein [Saprospiraceae bacterium]